MAAPAKTDTLILSYTQGFSRNHISHQLLPLKGIRLAGRGKPEVRNLLLFVWVCFLSKCRASSSAWEQSLRLKSAPDRTSLMGARLWARRFRNKRLKLAIAKSRSPMKFSCHLAFFPLQHRFKEALWYTCIAEIAITFTA